MITKFKLFENKKEINTLADLESYFNLNQNNINNDYRNSSIIEYILKCNIINHKYQIISDLLDKYDIDLNKVNIMKESVLIYAIIDWRYDIAKLLIDNGIDINLQDQDGFTALHWISKRPKHIFYHDLIFYLIENDADWSLKDINNKVFLDYLNDENKNIIINKYKNRYKNYLKKIQTTKFKL